MDYTINTAEQRILITCTDTDLAEMETFDQRIYGVPNHLVPGEPVTQVYRAAQPWWKYDRVLATVEDFEAQTAYLPLQDPDAQAEYSLTVSAVR